MPDGSPAPGSPSPSPPASPNGLRMPPEWAPHERTWMAWPTGNHTFPSPAELAAARAAWAEAARTVRHFEPVTVIADPDDAAGARAALGPAIEVVQAPLDDAWMRDIGPTFVTGPAVQNGVGRQLGAVHWVFNGWGAQPWARWERDARVGAEVAALAGASAWASPLVNEGGGIHVDGEGTVLLTETVQLGPERNPGWTHERVEEEIHARLGTVKAIWLPRGLAADYGQFGTRGHVDLVAAFVRPGLVVAHTQPDPTHPDHELCRETVKLLRGSTDAKGRPLEVVELPAPTVTERDGEPVDYSYVNHYLCNGGVVLCAFDDPVDARTADTFGRLFPDREIALVDARTLFAAGGGIHCITQQQPAI